MGCDYNDLFIFRYRAATGNSVTMASVRRDGKELKQNVTSAATEDLAKFGNMCIYNIHLNASGKLIKLLVRASGYNKRTINKLSVLYDSVSSTCSTFMMNEVKSHSDRAC